MKKRILSLALGLIMALSLLPMAALAETVDSNTLYEALEYVRIHQQEIEVSNDTTNEELAQKVMELLKPLIPDGMEITATCDVQWGSGGGYRATTEKEGNLVADVYLHSGGNQYNWTVQITIPKVAVDLSVAEKVEEDAKAIAAAWADYFADVIITEENITKQSGPLLEMAKNAVKNGSQLKWMLGDKIFSTWFEKHYIRGTLQLTLDGHKKELDLDITINPDGSTTMNKPVVGSATPAPTPEPDPTPETPPTTPSANPVVALTNQKLTVNGEAKNTEIYNIDGSNYFKLRDMAALLSGTGSQFSVDYDAARSTIVVKTGAAYTAIGGELATGTDKSASAVASAQSIEIDGKKADLSAYNIGGNNFFKLRDLGTALGFDVDYDSATATMIVKSK